MSPTLTPTPIPPTPAPTESPACQVRQELDLSGSSLVSGNLSRPGESVPYVRLLVPAGFAEGGPGTPSGIAGCGGSTSGSVIGDPAADIEADGGQLWSQIVDLVLQPADLWTSKDKFAEPVTVCIAVSSSWNPLGDPICLGYYDRDSKSWLCEDSETSPSQADPTFRCGRTTHFTPFAFVSLPGATLPTTSTASTTSTAVPTTTTADSTADPPSTTAGPTTTDGAGGSTTGNTQDNVGSEPGDGDEEGSDTVLIVLLVVLLLLLIICLAGAMTVRRRRQREQALQDAEAEASAQGGPTRRELAVLAASATGGSSGRADDTFDSTGMSSAFAAASRTGTGGASDADEEGFVAESFNTGLATKKGKKRSSKTVSSGTRIVAAGGDEEAGHDEWQTIQIHDTAELSPSVVGSRRATAKEATAVDDAVVVNKEVWEADDDDDDDFVITVSPIATAKPKKGRKGTAGSGVAAKKPAGSKVAGKKSKGGAARTKRGSTIGAAGVAGAAADDAEAKAARKAAKAAKAAKRAARAEAAAAGGDVDDAEAKAARKAAKAAKAAKRAAKASAAAGDGVDTPKKAKKKESSRRGADSPASSKRKASKKTDDAPPAMFEWSDSE